MDEQELIGKVTARVLAELRERRAETIPVGVSVRHVHICPQDLAVLYGPGAQLTKARDLRQPGEFAAGETVTLVGPRMRSLEQVRILGPVRSRTQVELARTDAILLGIDPPVRRSGDLAGSAGLTLVGPQGSLRLSEGVIRANRHLHLSEPDAARFGVSDDQEVEIEVDGDKALVFRRVQVRVGKFISELHLDTDDANAAGIGCGARARLVRR